MDTIQRAIVAPPTEIIVHGAACRQILGNVAPLTSRAQHIHQPVHHLAHGNRTLPAASLRRRYQLLNAIPLRVGQIARVAEPVTVVAGAVLCRPHLAPLRVGAQIESQFIQWLQPNLTKKIQVIQMTRDVPGRTLRGENPILN